MLPKYLVHIALEISVIYIFFDNIGACFLNKTLFLCSGMYTYILLEQFE